MALKLRVISEQYQQLGKHSTRLFGVTGGRIGRSADNDWILPDPDRYISSHHAQIRFDAGRWVIEDTSTNGVFVNGTDIPLSEQGPYSLQDGDHIRMGDYDILVSLDERADFSPDASGQIPVVLAPKQKPAVAKPVVKAKEPEEHEYDDLGAEIDINALLSGEISDFATSNHSGAFAVGNVYGVHVKDDLPSTAASSTSIPTLSSTDVVGEIYEEIPLTDNAPPRSLAQMVAANTAPSSATDEWHLRTRRLQKGMSSLSGGRGDGAARHTDAHGEVNAGIEAFCRGAGVDRASLPGEMQTATLALVGQMLREVVLGLMEALKNRGEFKGKFDPTQTIVQSSDNNPLKTALDVDDALRKLMDTHNSRHMGPVEALREAFSDLRTHQLAINSAVHTGVNGLMQKINPNDLQERFDRGLKRGGLLGAATNKMKYWDMYGEFFQALNQRNADGLPVAFGEEFIQAYLERNKAGKKK